MLIAAKLTVDIAGTIMTLQAFGKVVRQIADEDLPREEGLLTAPLLHLYILKEMSLCKLVDTNYPFLSVLLLLTVLSFIFIYFTFFALTLFNFDILNGVDTK